MREKFVPEWLTWEINEALAAITGDHVVKKETTVLRVAQAVANGEPISAVFAQPDTCSRTIWHGKYGDGMNLNQRIWRLENGGLANIRNTLRTSMAERTNAFTLASLLEEQIGAEDKLPAWTAPTGITATTSTNTTTTATVWLSGGTLGEYYRIVNHITTAAGRQDDRTIVIQMVAK